MLTKTKNPEHGDLIAFGDHCIWVWECNQIAKRYCNEESIEGWCEIDSQLSIILKEYALLQIAKTHDPAKSGKFDNHSMQYYCKKYGCDYKSEIKGSESFIKSIILARKKIIAHNDLGVMRRGDGLGGFSDGEDQKYFETLHTALNNLYQMAGIGPFPDWPTFITSDIEMTIQKISQVVGRRIEDTDAHH